MYSVLVVRIIAGIAGGMLADKKGRDRLGWALLCGFFPPLFFLLLILSPKLASGTGRKCPFCHNIVHPEDEECKKCKRVLPIELVRCGNCLHFVPEKEYCVECHQRMGQ